MPRTPLNTMPFDPVFGGERQCPRCQVTKALTPQNWTGRWHTLTEEDLYGNATTRRVRRPTVYCRVCVNAAKTNHRTVRKILDSAPPELKAEWSAAQRGACEVCGGVSNRRGLTPRFDRPWTLCLQCIDLLAEADRSDDPLKWTLRRSVWFARHLLDEKRIESEMKIRTDRDYQPHIFNPDYKEVHYSHLVCVSLELSWRKLYQWLKDNDPPEPFAL